jgi:hypothetical protein
MQILTKRFVATLVIMVAGLQPMRDSRALGAASPPTATIVAAALAQTVAAPAPVGQSQPACPTVATLECVQVPVTYTQTCYRTECRTETVPVTRMVPEMVNETRTITTYEPKQEVVNKQFTRYVCEPTTVVQKCYRPIPETKNVERTIYQTHCTTEMTKRVITRMVPQCVTETVPVTRMRQTVETQLCNVTQKVPVTTMVPVVTCAHQCGHRCGGGCGSCGGVTTCVQYRPVTTCYEQQVQVKRPVVKYIPETKYVQCTRTKFVPEKHEVTVPEVRVHRTPIKITQCVTSVRFEAYDVNVTRMVPKPITQTVPVCVTKMIPHSCTVTVPTVRCRPVTETVTRQVSVCVPYQVPVTVMTTQMRPVAAPAASAQTSASAQSGR